VLPVHSRVFVAHTSQDCLEVIDHAASHHFTTLSGFPEAAGVVADDGQVLVTNRLYVFSPAHGGVLLLGET
jgi:hypothetical protein